MQEEKLFRAAKSGEVEHVREALKSPSIDIDQVNKVKEHIFRLTYIYAWLIITCLLCRLYSDMAHTVLFLRMLIVAIYFDIHTDNF